MRLADFEGRWRLERVIEDRLGGPARFSGEAAFVPDGIGLVYEERGWLDAPAGRFQAERRYLWREDGQGIVVCFDDGRFFHRIGAEAAHWCEADDYRVRYDFSGWPVWRAVWRVTGPRKDYLMDSVYRR
ncbi:DUF6314 family protein [Mesobacterium sp. TK19101]|uniref:DUF6314 family protein n=1 Tax=Mesobacterium hydrothermale TaxID=3111907 RepID=A0ABU6HIL5_9RHOB|nr:DUF6314 family protein [Mesobacterium sp. TK19101]MEC3861670.1 DUF6314 family protein [Mesobacterium sp. TK19101]